MDTKFICVLPLIIMFLASTFTLGQTHIFAGLQSSAEFCRVELSYTVIDSVWWGVGGRGGGIEKHNLESVIIGLQCVQRA